MLKTGCFLLPLSGILKTECYELNYTDILSDLSSPVSSYHHLLLGIVLHVTGQNCDLVTYWPIVIIKHICKNIILFDYSMCVDMYCLCSARLNSTRILFMVLRHGSWHNTVISKLEWTSSYFTIYYQ